jgi:hypothetical protein
VVARKPLDGTVAATVQRWGTGALNVDGCRVGTASDKTKAPTRRGESAPWFTTADTSNLGGDDTKGRWPSNVVLSHSPQCDDGCCAEGCPVAELDRQSGTTRDGVAVRHRGVKAGMYGPDLKPGSADLGYGGQGGASRYFPTFTYQAKAPARERPEAPHADMR